MLFTQSAAPPTDALKKKYDYSGDNMIYEGWAIPGTSTAMAAWAIKKYTYSGSAIITEEWANGTSLQINVWDNRASLTYA